MRRARYGYGKCPDEGQIEEEVNRVEQEARFLVEHHGSLDYSSGGSVCGLYDIFGWEGWAVGPREDDGDRHMRARVAHVEPYSHPGPGRDVRMANLEEAMARHPGWFIAYTTDELMRAIVVADPRLKWSGIRYGKTWMAVSRYYEIKYDVDFGFTMAKIKA